MSEGPLSGIRVLDMSRVLAGPHCSRIMADLGADVIKVEPPEGDLTRFATTRTNSMSVYYAQQNVGKRNISLDLRKPEAVEIILRLVPHSDVLLENFRPGVMDRMGLGYEKVSSINPGIVYASISGYGQTGPWSSRPTYAPMVHAEMGWVEVVARGRDGIPFHDPLSHADVYSGVYGAVGVLAALQHRERTGQGQHVDLAMAEVLMSANEHLAAEHVRERKRPAHFDDPHPIFKMKDGSWVSASAGPTQRGAFSSWCTAMDKPDLGDDPRFADEEARDKHRDELLDVLQEWVLTFDSVEELEAALDKGRLVLGVIRTITEAAATDWAKERGAVVKISDRKDGEISVPNTPWRFSETSSGVTGQVAHRGEHNREVLRDLLGMTDEEIDKLETDEVLSSRLPKT
jgi:CoA:oxalate CoA-transferase